jgi:hypothetical protein
MRCKTTAQFMTKQLKSLKLKIETILKSIRTGIGKCIFPSSTTARKRKASGREGDQSKTSLRHACEFL